MSAIPHATAYEPTTTSTAPQTVKVCPINRAIATINNRKDPKITQRHVDGAVHVLLDEIDRERPKAEVAMKSLRGMSLRAGELLGTGAYKRFVSVVKTNTTTPIRRERTAEERDAVRKRHEANKAARSAENRERNRGGTGSKAGASKVVGPTNPRAIARREKKLAAGTGKRKK